MACGVVAQGYRHVRRQGRCCVACISCNMLVGAFLIIVGIITIFISFHDQQHSQLVNDYNEHVLAWNRQNSHLFSLPANTTLTVSSVDNATTSLSPFVATKSSPQPQSANAHINSLPPWSQVGGATWSASTTFNRVEGASLAYSLLAGDDLSPYTPIVYQATLPVFPNVSSSHPFSPHLSFKVSLSLEGDNDGEGDIMQPVISANQQLMMQAQLLETDMWRRVYAYCQIDPKVSIRDDSTNVECARARCVNELNGVFYADAHKRYEPQCEVRMIPDMFCARVNTTTWQVVGGCDYDDLDALITYRALSSADSAPNPPEERAGMRVYLVSADDPFFYALEITDGSLFFGLRPDDHRSIGATYVVIGAALLIIIVCGVFVMGVLSESKFLLKASPHHQAKRRSSSMRAAQSISEGKAEAEEKVGEGTASLVANSTRDVMVSPSSTCEHHGGHAHACADVQQVRVQVQDSAVANAADV